MLIIPAESLQLQRTIVSALSRHTFAIVQPSKHGVENQELGTGVGVQWKGTHLILTAGHVVEHCQEDLLRFLLPARNIEFAGTEESQRQVSLEIRQLLKLRDPTLVVLPDDPVVDLAAIVLPSPQRGAEECFAVLDEMATMPPDGTQVGVFGYPGALKIPIGKDYMATPEHFFAELDATGKGCLHQPPQHELTVPYGLPHRADGYSGSGVWHFIDKPIWTPEPHLCGIVTRDCTVDRIVSGFGIGTILRFLQDKEALLLPDSTR